MPNVNDFIRRYSNISFSEKPFCDADNIAFCKISYMMIENVVSESFDDEPVMFDEMAKKMFAFNGNKHKPVGLLLFKDISTTFMQMAQTKRYSELKVVACKSVLGYDPAVQFAAATFIAPDGSLIVYFRGTDDTLVGWKEDVDIFIKGGAPSHQLAVDYVNELASKFDGDIILLGHSKGGNVALYAAMHCDKEVRDRIRTVYNNEGPGFNNFDYLESEEYKEILPKYAHYIPNSAFFGLFLTHDEDYTVIKSTQPIGPLQHDVSSWQIDGDELRRTEMSRFGCFNDKILARFITLNEHQCDVAEIFFSTVINKIEQKTLTDVAKHMFSAATSAIKAWKSFDEDTKKMVSGFFSGFTKEVKPGYYQAKRKEAMPVNTRKILLGTGIPGLK